MRDAELFRRPPFLVGDEAAVLRYTRRFRKRRRLIQLGFVGGVVGLAALLTVLQVPDIAVGAGAFASLSTAFVVAHLGAGSRGWMRPMEAYEDGLVGSEITLLFCRRRFVPWKDFEALSLEGPEGRGSHLVARFAGGRALESAPAEFDGAGLGEMRARVERAKRDAAAARALIDALGAGAA